MLQKIEAYMRKYHMIKEGSHVIAGVSGGADSVCMLMVLLQLREIFGYTISAVHIEHGIRGRESMEDAAFVEDLCRQKKIACRVFHCNVPDYAKQHRLGLEEAGRQLRYALLEAEWEQCHDKEARIAVAHNSNDNAETMLFHLARGTGIRGLAGIAPIRGHIIRPLLEVNRQEIEDFLKQEKQRYCQDATNASLHYSRNKIRHNMLPVLEQVNSRAIRHMSQAATDLREIAAYLNEQVQKELRVCSSYPIQDGSVQIQKDPFLRADSVLQREMLYTLMSELSGGSKDITKTYIAQLLKLFSCQTGKQMQFPCQIAAMRTYAGITLFREPASDMRKEPDMLDQTLFDFRVVERNSKIKPQIYKKKYTKCFDYDKIKNGFCIRNRLPGDYLVIQDCGCRQKLKNFFVNEKIPANERGRIPLLADGAHIMWIVGYRMSSYYKVTEHTKRILEVTFYGGKEDG